MNYIALIGSAALITSTASATFTGWTITVASVTGSLGARDVYSVYANFNNSTDIVLNVFDFGKAVTTIQGNQILAGRSGTMQAVHNDNLMGDIDVDGDGVIDVYNSLGSWEAANGTQSATQALTDSYVTMQGINLSWGTAMDPSFTPSWGATANDSPTTAGWYDSTPGTANVVGATQKVKLLQISRVAGNMAAFTANITMGYKATGTTTPLFGFGSFSIGTGGPDSDSDGIPDPIDNCPTIANPTQANNDGDSQGDVCDADDDNDGVIDTVDNCHFVANPSQADCNANGIGDICETNALDCNLDTVPDTCQGAIMYSSTSPNLGAPSGDDVRTFTFSDLSFAESSVQLTIDVRGDLNGATEWIDVSLNGGTSRRFFDSGGNDCPETPDRAVIVLAREQFAALIGTSRSLTISLSCPATVDPTECKGTGLTQFDIAYVGINAVSGDCDGDHRLDVCEIHDGIALDCNNNKRPDSCDIASGFAIDCNNNGIPDSCDVGGSSAIDCNANSIPDSCDIAAGTSHDIDSNGKPDECQTVTVPGNYANIQAAINTAPAGQMRIVALGAGIFAGPINIDGKAIVIRGSSAATSIIQGSAGATASVVVFNNAPALAAVEKVTIRGGLSGSPIPGSPQYNVGGGVFSNNSAASIRDCIIEENTAGFGGGIYCLQSTSSIERCIVRNNHAGSDGGGILLYGGAPHVTDTVVEGNFANSRGGGMHIVQGTPQLLRTAIRTNTSNNIVGGLSWASSGSPSAFLTLHNCVVTGNTAAIIQGGIGILPNGPTATIALTDTTVCSNLPRPNISGLWADLSGNTVCDCAGDVSADGLINGIDLSTVLSDWGLCSGNCPADINHDGEVSGLDLSIILSSWGTCNN